VAGEVVEGASDAVDLLSLGWAVVKLPFKVVGAVFDAFT
jgi:hypothetical protein